MNEKKAFAIMRKADKRVVYKDEESGGYLVSNNYFVFKTYDKESILSLGLIDFEGNPRENTLLLRDIMQQNNSAVEYTYSGLMLENYIDGKKTCMSILTSETGISVVNKIYFDVFENDDCTITSNGKLYAPIYIGNHGAILPIRFTSEILTKLNSLYVKQNVGGENNHVLSN